MTRDLTAVRCGVVTLGLLACGWASGDGRETDGSKDPRPAVELHRVAGGAELHAVGLDAQILSALRLAQLDDKAWSELFVVHTGPDMPREASARTPLLGSYAVERDRIRFVPDFPLVDGLTYVARLELPLIARRFGAGSTGEAYGTAVEISVTLPAGEPADTTVVTEVFPASDRLPENLLKFYVHFSAPMSRGEARERVHLLSDAGTEVQLPFYDLRRELWDPQRRRLTLLLDPGRIKRGLRPHEEAGPPLVAGQSYRLVIDGAWRDAQGFPLGSSFTKRFEVGAADRKSPQSGEWAIEPPPAGSRDPLRVVFDEPLDHALLMRVIRVRDADGRLKGTARTTSEETVWEFVPNAAWSAGRYELIVDPILEDLAGNNLTDIFDVDLKKSSMKAPRGEVKIDFLVSDGSSVSPRKTGTSFPP